LVLYNPLLTPSRFSIIFKAVFLEGLFVQEWITAILEGISAFSAARRRLSA
jgi:hypothetical protein